MIPDTIRKAILEEFAVACNSPQLAGKYIATATIIRRIEIKRGFGFCRGVDQDEVFKLIQKAAGR